MGSPKVTVLMYISWKGDKNEGLPVGNEPSWKDSLKFGHGDVETRSDSSSPCPPK